MLPLTLTSNFTFSNPLTLTFTFTSHHGGAWSFPGRRYRNKRDTMQELWSLCQRMVLLGRFIYYVLYVFLSYLIIFYFILFYFIHFILFHFILSYLLPSSVPVGQFSLIQPSSAELRFALILVITPTHPPTPWESIFQPLLDYLGSRNLVSKT